ncbi:hypothetical protein MRX96_033148 [Rhipicephalus microplus]
MATMLANMLKFALVTAIFIVGLRSEDSQAEDASSHRYNIRLDNRTSFEITTHGFQEFSKCLKRGATKENNTVDIVKFNKCARDLYDRVQSNITDHLRIRDVGELGTALRNLSSLHRLNGNIVKNLEALQNSFQRLRLPHSGGAQGTEPLQRTLQSASEAFRNMSKSVTSGAALQTVVHNFNRTLQTFNSIATAGVNAMTPTANQLMHRFQEDLKNIQNVTRSLPRTDVARLTEQTRGEPDLAGAQPDWGPACADATDGHAGSREHTTAYDGFQLAVNNGMLAMSDLVRGSLKLVNPANWHVGRVGLGTVDGQTPQAGINKFIGHLFRRRG